LVSRCPDNMPLDKPQLAGQGNKIGFISDKNGRGASR